MENRQENKMGVMPVKKLIITMSLPMMASMLVQALYNIVDSIFVARLSEEALTSVTLAFPLQNMMIAVASGTGVGVNALLSKALGEKKFERSDKAANMAILLSFCNYILFLLISLLVAGPFIYSQTQDPVVAGEGITYLKIVTGLSMGLMCQVMFERLLQSTGRTVYSMISQMTGAIINIILDPIMIFGYFGMPALGVAGAAYATVIGQSAAALIEETYEAYGPGGVGIIIEVATDNKNRTMPEVRHTLEKNGGRMADPGSVMFQFTRKGVIFTKSKGDEIMMAALDAGAEDVVDEDDGTTIYTVASDLMKVRGALIDAGYEIDSAELQYVPNNTVPVEGETGEKVEKILDAIDDLDDVVAVHTNAE